MDSNVSNTRKNTGLYPKLDDELNNAANDDKIEFSSASTSFGYGNLHFRKRPGIHDRPIDPSHPGIHARPIDPSHPGIHARPIDPSHLGIHNRPIDPPQVDITPPSVKSSSFIAPENPFAAEPHAEITPAQPKPEPPLDTDELKNEGSWRLIIGIIACCICVLLSWSTCVLSIFKPQPLLPQYLKEIENLKSNSGQQTEYFWDIIKSFPYDLLSEKNPNTPAVLLLVTPAGGINQALQLTRQIANTLNRLLDSDSNNVPVINGNNLAVHDPGEQKMLIDEQIRDFVENEKQRAVVVANLEKIDPMAIMIFHAYCDNSEAVYKDIAIILLLELPAGVSTENEKDILSHLTEIWSPLGKSTISALFTRLANNVAILDAE